MCWTRRLHKKPIIQTRKPNMREQGKPATKRWNLLDVAMQNPWPTPTKGFWYKRQGADNSCYIPNLLQPLATSRAGIKTSRVASRTSSRWPFWGNCSQETISAAMGTFACAYTDNSGRSCLSRMTFCRGLQTVQATTVLAEYNFMDILF